MRIDAIEWRPYGVRLREGGVREGFIVRARTEHRLVGLGEAAGVPGPGSPEVAEIEKALRTFVAKVRGSPLDAACEGLSVLSRDVVESHDEAESSVAAVSDAAKHAALAGLVTALLDLRARVERIPLARLLDETARTHVRVNALLTDDEPNTLASQTRRFVDAGFRTVKLKVGRASLDDDVSRVFAVASASAGRSDVRLRLDANRAWSFDEAVRFLDRVVDLRIDYVEEPLREPSPERLATLRSRTGVALALDESIETGADLAPFCGGALDVVVLKLQRVGGLLAAHTLAGIAEKRGLRVVVTDSLETPVGQRAALHAAAVLTDAGECAGIAGAFLFDRRDHRVPPAAVELSGDGLGAEPEAPL